MYQDIKQLLGRKIGACDGDIGHVKDFYFDDRSWAVRYVIVDTGTWMAGHQVLLSPHAFGTQPFGRAETENGALRVSLTRKQIEECPSIETHRPVSRQYEEDYYRYYGWPTYWEGGGMWGAAGFPVAPPPTVPESLIHPEPVRRDEIHLRSMNAVTGYQIQATDGQIGTVSSFMVEIWSWAIREVVVETGHWYSGKPILILPENIRRISYEDSTVFVNLTKADLQQTTKNDVAQAAVAHAGPGDAND